jgi:uncharacterized membrane protein
METVTPQERADRLRIFRRELAQLEEQKVLQLTAEQRARLDAHLEGTLHELASRYDVDTSESERRISWGMRVASVLGGLALCAAVVLFFARYLGLWPTWVQVAVMVAVPVFLTLAADYAASREKNLYYAALICVVAFAAFVIDLKVLGTIFNLTPTPNAFAVWGLFGLALAYHFGLRLILAAGLVSVLGWLTATSSFWRGLWWLDFDRRPEDVMVAGMLLAFLPFLVSHVRWPDFPAVYRLVGLLAFFVSVLILSASGQRSYLPWEWTAVEHAYQTFGLAASAAAVWAGIRQNWTGVVNLGTAFFTLFLLIRLIDWWWQWMPKYLFFLLVGVVAIGLVAVFKRLRSSMRSAA